MNVLSSVYDRVRDSGKSQKINMYRTEHAQSVDTLKMFLGYFNYIVQLLLNLNISWVYIAKVTFNLLTTTRQKSQTYLYCGFNRDVSFKIEKRQCKNYGT